MAGATWQWSLAGLCICFLAISAAAIPSSTIFYCTFVPLLLFGCSLFARSLLLASQARPVVAGKQHRKHGQLKMDKVENDSGASMQKTFINDIDVDSLSIWKNWILDGKEISSNWPKCQQDISDPANAYVHVSEAHTTHIWIDICVCI